MSIKLHFGEEVINVISAYDLQVGCDEEEKQEFWGVMETVMTQIPPEERCIVGGDLIGHVGQENDIIQRVHGGHGVG